MELQTGLGHRHDQFGSLAPVRRASTNLSIALLQLTSTDDVSKNVATIIELLALLQADVPDLICLPENSLYFRVKERSLIPSLSLVDPRLKPLIDWAKTYATTLHLGSIPREENEKLFNSSVVIRPDGQLQDVYRKIHLFDVDVAGHKPIRESDVFSPGLGPAIFDVRGWKIGSSICYDLRFAELYSVYARAGVDLILIPSAFIVPTGQAHWDILTRARAIESQAYVAAAAQGGTHIGDSGTSRATYGHSIIVDPWGEVIETLPDDFQSRRILRAVLSKERIRAVRDQIPMRSHRQISFGEMNVLDDGVTRGPA